LCTQICLVHPPCELGAVRCFIHCGGGRRNLRAMCVFVRDRSTICGARIGRGTTAIFSCCGSDVVIAAMCRWGTLVSSVTLLPHVRGSEGVAVLDNCCVESRLSSVSAMCRGMSSPLLNWRSIVNLCARLG